MLLPLGCAVCGGLVRSHRPGPPGLVPRCEQGLQG